MLIDEDEWPGPDFIWLEILPRVYVSGHLAFLGSHRLQDAAVEYDGKIYRPTVIYENALTYGPRTIRLECALINDSRQIIEFSVPYDRLCIAAQILGDQLESQVA